MLTRPARDGGPRHPATLTSATPAPFSPRIIQLTRSLRRARPQIGMVTIIMNDYPIVKYILVGLMGLFVLTTKE